MRIGGHWERPITLTGLFVATGAPVKSRLLVLLLALAMAGCASAATITPPTSTPATSSPTSAPSATATATPSEEPSPTDTVMPLAFIAHQLAPPDAIVWGDYEGDVVYELYLRTTMLVAELEAFWDQQIAGLGIASEGKLRAGGGVVYVLSDPFGSIAARPLSGETAIVISLAPATPPATAAPPDVVFSIEVTRATPCCELLEDGPGRATDEVEEQAEQAAWRRGHAALVDAADLFVAVRSALLDWHADRGGVGDHECAALAVADRTQYETIVAYLGVRGTGSSLVGRELVRFQDPVEIADAIHVPITDLEVTRVEGPRYALSPTLSVSSYGYEVSAQLEVVSTEESAPATASVGPQFPDEIGLPRVEAYFAGASFSDLALEMLPYLDSVIGDPCAAGG